jgi:hypothetical protein
VEAAGRVAAAEGSGSVAAAEQKQVVVTIQISDSDGDGDGNGGGDGDGPPPARADGAGPLRDLRLASDAAAAGPDRVSEMTAGQVHSCPLPRPEDSVAAVAAPNMVGGGGGAGGCDGLPLMQRFRRVLAAAAAAKAALDALVTGLSGLAELVTEEEALDRCAALLRGAAADRLVEAASAAAALIPPAAASEAGFGPVAEWRGASGGAGPRTYEERMVAQVAALEALEVVAGRAASLQAAREAGGSEGHEAGLRAWVGRAAELVGEAQRMMSDYCELYATDA